MRIKTVARLALAAIGPSADPLRSLPGQTNIPPAAWDGIVGGEYGVGFDSWTVDAPPDGGAISRRRVQVQVWFPLRRTSSGVRLRYLDYVVLAATELGSGALPAERQRAVAEYARLLGQDGIAVSSTDSLLIIGTGAMRARFVSAPGARRIAIAYGNGQSAPSQVILSELLASHGLVVVAVPSPTRGGARMENERDLLPVARRQAADLELALREVVVRSPSVGSVAAIVGDGFGARAGLLLLARGVSPLLVSLDGGIGSATERDWIDSSGVVPERMRGVIVHLYGRGDPQMSPNLGLWERLTGTRRELLLLPGFAHWQFTSLGVRANLVPGIAPPRPAVGEAANTAGMTAFVACMLRAAAESTADQRCPTLLRVNGVERRTRLRRAP